MHRGDRFDGGGEEGRDSVVIGGGGGESVASGDDAWVVGWLRGGVWGCRGRLNHSERALPSDRPSRLIIGKSCPKLARAICTKKSKLSEGFQAMQEGGLLQLLACLLHLVCRCSCLRLFRCIRVRIDVPLRSALPNSPSPVAQARTKPCRFCRAASFSVKFGIA